LFIDAFSAAIKHYNAVKYIENESTEEFPIVSFWKLKNSISRIANNFITELKIRREDLDTRCKIFNFAKSREGRADWPKKFVDKSNFLHAWPCANIIYDLILLKVLFK
jgi:hypothetical protein